MSLASPYAKHLRACKKQLIERNQPMTIITSETRNPTPNKMLDWQAHFKDYEGGDVIGYGETPELATEDLLEQNRCHTCGDIHYPAPLPLDCKQGN